MPETELITLHDLFIELLGVPPAEFVYLEHLIFVLVVIYGVREVFDCIRFIIGCVLQWKS